MKKTLIVIGLVIAVATGLFYFWRTPEKKEVAKLVPPIVNEFPSMTFIMTDGSFRSAKDLPDSSILFLYFPDCDHCQRQATEISKNLKAFKKYSIWFISTATYQDIEKFASAYKLIGYSNFHFVRTETQDVVNNFGAIPTPSWYIFSDNKKFVKAFNGETKIEEIIKVL